MPIAKSLKETWTAEFDGTTYTLAPINATAQAKAMDLAQSERLNEALLLCTQAGLRGWTNADETISRVTPEDLERLSLRERAQVGDAIFARCILRSEEQD